MVQNKKTNIENEESQARVGRGGARAGAGRKSGSGAFGEATVPMRIPVSLAVQVEAALEEFKVQHLKALQASEQVSPLDLSKLSGSAMSIVMGSPSGKPLDLANMISKRPESCFAWTSSLDYSSFGVNKGDVLIIDRSCNASSLSLCAYWGNEGIELAKASKLPKGVDAWGVAVGLVRKLTD